MLVTGMAFQTSLAAPTLGIVPAALLLSSDILISAYILSPKLVGAAGGATLASSAAIGAFLLIQYGTPAGVVPPAVCTALLLLRRSGMAIGGADIKCLVSLAVALPSLPGEPLMWPAPQIPVMAVTFWALALCMCYGIRNAVANAIEGNMDASMFSEVRMPISRARTAHVWPAEDAVDGKIRRVGRTGPEAYDRLEKNGARDVAVIPKIPFIVPVAASLAMVMALGDPLCALTRCRGPRSCSGRTRRTCPPPGTPDPRGSPASL